MHIKHPPKIAESHCCPTSSLLPPDVRCDTNMLYTMCHRPGQIPKNLGLRVPTSNFGDQSFFVYTVCPYYIPVNWKPAFFRCFSLWKGLFRPIYAYSQRLRVEKNAWCPVIGSSNQSIDSLPEGRSGMVRRWFRWVRRSLISVTGRSCKCSLTMQGTSPWNGWWHWVMPCWWRKGSDPF